MSRPDIRELVGHHVARGHHGDVIAAMAFADSLGAMAWRLKFGNDHTVYWKIVDEIARRLRRVARGRLKRDLLHRIAEVCLREMLAELCTQCGGRGMLITERVQAACTHCAGTGIGRASDIERARRIGVSADRYQKVEHLFVEGHRLLADAMRRAGLDIASHLGWRQ